MSGPFDPGNAAGDQEQAPPTTVPPPAPAGEGLGLGASDLGTLIGQAVAAAGGQQESKAPPFQSWLASLFGGSVTGTDPATAPAMTGLRTQGGHGARAAGNVHEVIAQVGRLSSAELSYLQRRLFQAGFYSSEVYANASVIDWGTVDSLTVAALEAAFTDAAAGQVSDFDAFLDNKRAHFLRTGLTSDGTSLDPGDAAEAQSVINVTLEDPDTIRQLAESTAIELLGRKPTEEELSRITAKIHADQREVGRQRARAEQGGASQLPDLSDEAGLLRGESGVPVTADPAASQITQLSAEQAEVATTIIQVGQEMGLSEEYIIGALSAGIVESGLRNVNYGDRDSLGVFQQRGHYGSAEQRLDVRRSAQMFYQEMLRTKATGDLGEWVADTQRPAKQYRGRYGEKMNDAARIYQLLGNVSSRPMNPRQGEARSRVVPAPVGVRSTRPGGDNPRNVGRAFQPGSAVTTQAPLPHPDEENPFWLDRYAGVGNSQQDPIFNEIMGVDVGASIAEELKRIDPVGYATRQAAAKTYEFFSLLGAGGGAI